jgi:hypothetical protein
MTPAKHAPERGRRGAKRAKFGEKRKTFFLCALGVLAGENFLKWFYETYQQADMVSKNIYTLYPRLVTPEWFYRGSSRAFPWIPASA